MFRGVWRFFWVGGSAAADVTVCLAGTGTLTVALAGTGTLTVALAGTGGDCS